MSKATYDVVILGAGHNGLVAATYLARAGLSVLLLEKNDYVGGATTSTRVFPDYDAWLSRYSYLVSLFPGKIICELGLDLELRRRATGSFTPYQKDGRHDGLLLSNVSEETSRQSVAALTGSESEFEQMKKFYALARTFAEKTWDSFLEPLVSKEEMAKHFAKDELSREAWRSLVEEPLGLSLERYLQDDLLRGLVFTDGKIGVSTYPYDPTLLQNRCFLYHLIGNKTGEWKVPVGGMGAVAQELEEAARTSGAEIVTSVHLRKLDLSGKERVVEFERDGKAETVNARFLLVNFGRNVLSQLIGETFQPDPNDEGSVFKINLLLKRLPKLKATRYPAAEAFCGTFHIDEGYREMNLSYEKSRAGQLPEKLPSEIYCHTLTDDSILSSELRAQGFHTLTLFGIDTPWSLFAGANETMRQTAERRFLEGINHWLAEPLEDCLAVARDGSFCLESKSPVDIEESLGLFHGNIFQSAPTFPFAATPEQVGTWGVETEWENVFLCGSSAHRGGAVSGIPGHNAARKVLELIH
ncbi:MAG TPA: NAD(P)/FAD-dependent oxidoreductase [Chthoniobacterales bacterium]|jgi:phytoene dehydrogenase-like protein